MKPFPKQNPADIKRQKELKPPISKKLNYINALLGQSEKTAKGLGHDQKSAEEFAVQLQQLAADMFNERLKFQRSMPIERFEAGRSNYSAAAMKPKGGGEFYRSRAFAPGIGKLPGQEFTNPANHSERRALVDIFKQLGAPGFEPPISLETLTKLAKTYGSQLDKVLLATERVPCDDQQQKQHGVVGRTEAGCDTILRKILGSNPPFRFDIINFSANKDDGEDGLTGQLDNVYKFYDLQDEHGETIRGLVNILPEDFQRHYYGREKLIPPLRREKLMPPLTGLQFPVSAPLPALVAAHHTMNPMGMAPVLSASASSASSTAPMGTYPALLPPIPEPQPQLEAEPMAQRGTFEEAFPFSHLYKYNKFVSKKWD